MSDEAQHQSILTVNAGSSSIKFALYDIIQLDEALITGSINKIGEPESTFVVNSVGSIGSTP